MLTHTAILRAKAADKPYKLEREQGLFILVNPNGSKLWRFAYSYGGKEKLLSFGAFPAVSLGDARQRRGEARKILAGGADPSAERKAEKEAQAVAAINSFEAMAELWFKDEIDGLSESYKDGVRRTLDRDILPYIGKRPLREITSRELLTVFDRIKDRGAEETWRRARVNVGQVFRYALRRGITDNDPTYALRGERRKSPVRHFAALTDPEGAARLMRAIRGQCQREYRRFRCAVGRCPHVAPPWRSRRLHTIRSDTALAMRQRLSA